MTKGGVYGALARFALPFLLANFIQALYGAADLAVVGWFGTAAEVSAVSTGTQVMQILLSMVSGLVMGGTVLIGRYYGAGDREKVQTTVNNTLGLFTYAGVLFTVLLLIFCDPALWALQTPQAAFAGAQSYVRVAACGTLFVFGYNAVAAVLRALGDSKSPLLFVAVACAANVVLDFLLVGGFGMGPAGAALATILSQGLSLCYAVWHIRRKMPEIVIGPACLRLSSRFSRRILGVGFPVSLQETLVQVSFLFMAAIVNRMGVEASAAVGICSKFDGFAMLPPSAFGAALAAFAAQNLGAGKPGRAKKALTASVGMSLAAALVFFLWAQVSPLSIMGVFGAEKAVAQAGALYLQSFSIDFILVCFVFCMNGFFNGCGKTGFTMAVSLVSTVGLRIPLAAFLSSGTGGLYGLGFAAPAASLFSILFCLVYFLKGGWREERRPAAENND